MSVEPERTASLQAMEHDVDDESSFVSAAGTRSRWWRPRSVADWLFVITVAAAVVPIAVATARAIARGWIPVGDDAFFTLRPRDAFTLDHLPLLGTGSSASLSVGQNLNNPGPLLFDVLALPAKLGGGPGVAVGAALINAVALLGIAIVGYRRGGAIIGALAATVGAALAWSMGSELLFEPLQPHVLVLPFLCFVTLAWAVSCGDLVALPWAAGVGSFVAQTHLSYVILVPLFGVWAIVGAALVLRRARRQDPSAWPGLRTRAIRIGLIATGVFVVCWLQPIIEQFTADGEGNLSRLLRHAHDPNVKTVGFRFGTRVVASVASLPPWWVRPSFENTLLPHEGWRAPSLLLAAGSLVGLVGVLCWCWFGSRRRRDRDASRIIVTAALALVFSLLSASRTPTTVLGTAVHVFRWVWPVAAFVTLAILVAIVRRFARLSVAITGVCALVAVTLGIMNLPTASYGGGPNSQQYAVTPIRDLYDKMGALEKDGPLLIDDLFRIFGNPYAAPVLAELQERDIPFVAKDPGLVRQIGPGRRYDGHNARSELLLRTAGAAFTPPPGSLLVARASALTTDEQRELSRLRRQVGEYVAAGRLRLNGDGRVALARGDLPVLRQQLQPDAGADPQAVLDSRELVVIVDRHEAALNGIWASRFERYAALEKRFDTETVALFVRPVGSRSQPAGGP
jgi:hypothetical protein